MRSAGTGTLRLALLQVRDDPRAEAQEREAFAAVGGLLPGQIRSWNLVSRPAIGIADLAGCDAVVIGGAGAHSVTEDDPFTAPLLALVGELVARRWPVFGSCYGHQFLARALGGRVLTDPEHGELGTFELHLTAAGAADPWLAGLPLSFDAQFGHNDWVVELPPGAVELAYTARCRHQAFRIGELPVYGAQFHVELDEARMLARAALYRDAYLPASDAMKRLADSLRPSPVAATLFSRFLALV